MKNFDFDNIKTQEELDAAVKQVNDYIDTLPKYSDQPWVGQTYASIQEHIKKVKALPGRAVSISQAKGWMKCKRGWALERTFADMTPKDFFALGKAVHVGLEVYNKSQGNLELALTLAKAELLPTIDYNFLSLFPLVSTMITGYIDFDKQNPDYTIIMNEIDFELVLGVAPDVDLTAMEEDVIKTKGVIDFIAVTTRDIVTEHGVIPKGEIIAGEYKTAKAAGNIDYDIDAQATLYLMALSKLFGFPIKYIVYNTLYKKLPKEPAVLKSGDISAQAISTTQQMYGDALIRTYGAIENAPEKCIALYNNLKAGLSGFFDRTYVHRSLEEIMEMEDRLIVLVPQVNEDHKRLNKPDGSHDFSHCYPNPGRDCKAMCSMRDKCINLNRRQPVVESKPFTVRIAQKKVENIEIGDDE